MQSKYTYALLKYVQHISQGLTSPLEQIFKRKKYTMQTKKHKIPHKKNLT